MRKIQESHSTFDRLIDGKAPAADSPADGLSLFVEQARRVAAIAPSPAAEQAHLRTILEQAQLLVDKGEPAARPASKATGPENQASGLPTRRRKVVPSSLFGSLTAKLAAAGVAVMMTGTGALAATGSLPDNVQNKFAVAAEVVGIDLPTGDEEVADTDTGGATDDGTDGTEATSGKSSSDDVHAAQDATDPGPERGKAVSEAARQKPGDESDPDTVESDPAESGNETSAAVHEAIESTEPGPERGKAVSEAASGGRSRGGEDTESDESEEGTENPAGKRTNKK
jgi:hypothetical protein